MDAGKWVTGAMLVVSAACGGAPTAPVTPAGDGAAGDAVAPPPTATPGPMTATPAHRFVRGAALSPGSLLIAWLDQAGTLTVRLPVVLVRTTLGARDARISGDALPIELDDGALGVSLADRLAAADLPLDAPGAIWLEGRWDGGTLHVTRVGDPISPDALAGVTHAELQAMP